MIELLQQPPLLPDGEGEGEVFSCETPVCGSHNGPGHFAIRPPPAIHRAGVAHAGQIFAHSIAEKRRLRKNDRRQQQTVLPTLLTAPHLFCCSSGIKTHHHIFLRVAVTNNSSCCVRPYSSNPWSSRTETGKSSDRVKPSGILM